MRKILLILLAIGLLASTAACGSQASAEPVDTTAAAVEEKGVEAFGVVKATEVKNILLDFQALVTDVHVKEGERVKAGQPLVSLDMSELENTRTNKELSLSAAKNNVSRVRSDTDLKKLQNDRKNAESIYARDSKELETKEQLYAAGSITLNELENFKKQVDSDKKVLEDIDYSMQSLKNSKGTENDQKSLESALLESDLKLLNSRLDKSYLKDSGVVSDMDNGLVYEIGYVPGDLAGPQKKLLSLMDLDSLVVEAKVPEEFIRDVEIGAAVKILPVADKTRQYAGTVTYISGLATDNNGETQVPVRIKVENLDSFLLPGFNVEVTIGTAAEKKEKS
jgi:multidrug resistance efflux pump